MRPHYETPEDRARERAAIERYVRYKGAGLSARKLTDASRLDFALMRDGRCCGLAEVKCRYRYTSAQMQRFGTLLLAKHKWDTAEDYCREHGIAFALIVALQDGVWWLNLSFPFPDVPMGVGGRTDRGDAADVEECVYIPWDWFFEL